MIVHLNEKHMLVYSCHQRTVGVARSVVAAAERCAQLMSDCHSPMTSVMTTPLTQTLMAVSSDAQQTI